MSNTIPSTLRGDKVFDIVNYTLVTLFVLVVLYPLYFVLIASVSDPWAVNRGEVWLWPKDFNFLAYEAVWEFKRIWTGYANTLLYATGGSTVAVLTTTGFAFALSRKEFVIRRWVAFALVFTMLFHGGLIPRFMLVKNLGLYDTRIYIMAFHNMTTVWWIIIARTFFAAMPEEIFDSAKMDGAKPAAAFWYIALPLSKAMMAVIFLFAFVMHWNMYFAALIYLSDAAKEPLQLVLRQLLLVSQMSTQATMEMMEDPESMEEALRTAELMKYAVMVVAAIPLLILYPFLQRYFVKGTMVGSLKG